MKSISACVIMSGGDMTLRCPIGRTLFNNANMLFIEYSRSENMTMKQLREQVSEMTTSIVSLTTPDSAELDRPED